MVYFLSFQILIKIKWYNVRINKNDFKSNKFRIKRKEKNSKNIKLYTRYLKNILYIFKKYYTNNIYTTKIFLFFNFIFVKFGYMT